MKISLILLAIAVVASGIVFFIIQSEDQPAATQQTESSRATPQSESEADTVTTDAAPVSGTGSFMELLQRERSLRCEIEVNDPEAGVTTGVTYIDGATERMRSDVEMQAGDMLMEASTIVKDDTMYTWSRSAAGDFAFQMSLNEETANEREQVVPEQPSGVSLDQEVSYACAPWSVDEKMFRLPSGIEFQSMDEMMQMPEGIEMPENLPQMQ